MSVDRDDWSDRDDEPQPRGPNPPAESAGDSRSGWNARLAIVRRELRSLRSEKTILLAIAIQLFIAAFSSFLVVGLVSMYDPGAVDGPETEIAVTGADTDALVAAANQQDGISPTRYDDPETAYDAFDSGRVAAVVDATRTDDGRLVVRATIPDEGLVSTLLVVQLRETLEAVEHAERVENADRLESQPLSLPDAVDASPYAGFTYTVLLPLLLFLPAFISGSIVVDSIVEERERGTLELLRVAPLSLVEVVDAKVLATAGLAPIQAMAWLALLAVNGTSVASPVALIVLVTALATLVVAVGAGLALAAPDRRQAQLLYSVSIVGALVLSTLLPEHPANTVAKLAIGNATTTTWALLATYCLLAIVAVAGLRVSVGQLEADAL